VKSAASGIEDVVGPAFQLMPLSQAEGEAERWQPLSCLFARVARLMQRGGLACRPAGARSRVCCVPVYVRLCMTYDHHLALLRSLLLIQLAPSLCLVVSGRECILELHVCFVVT
jgi:hypothetical protein